MHPEAAVIRDASTALQRALNSENAIPASIMRRAHAIAVFPATPTEAIFHEGSGVISGRGRRSHRWLPAIVSFKAKLRVPPGRRVGNIFIIALTRNGLDHLAHSVPRTTEIPPGPVGEDTTENMKTDFVAYGQYGRFFAGIRVDHVTIQEDATTLNNLYGPGVGLYEILNGRLKNGPPAALDWQEHVEAYFRELN
jgi:lipid-binding SYLF domain-containing protein